LVQKSIVLLHCKPKELDADGFEEQKNITT
jgi:hypothetical protein